MRKMRIESVEKKGDIAEAGGGGLGDGGGG